MGVEHEETTNGHFLNKNYPPSPENKHCQISSATGGTSNSSTPSMLRMWTDELCMGPMQITTVVINASLWWPYPSQKVVFHRKKYFKSLNYFLNKIFKKTPMECISKLFVNKWEGQVMEFKSYYLLP